LDIISLVLGILSIFVWPIPYVGYPVSVIGIILGILVIRRGKSKIALAGVILSSIGLALTLTNSVIGLLDIILKTYFQM